MLHCRIWYYYYTMQSNVLRHTCRYPRCIPKFSIITEWLCDIIPFRSDFGILSVPSMCYCYRVIPCRCFPYIINIAINLMSMLSSGAIRVSAVRTVCLILNYSEISTYLYILRNVHRCITYNFQFVIELPRCERFHDVAKGWALFRSIVYYEVFFV